MKIAVYTRSRNDVLYQRMNEFIPAGVDRYRSTYHHRWEDSVNYLFWILEHAAKHGIDYILNIDEDCFITNWDVVLQLVNHVAENNITHAGVPDGGVIPHRTRSWAVQNPFFNVFNVKLCNSIVGQKHRHFINAFQYKNITRHTAPVDMVYAFNHDNDEPFTGFFYYLHDKGQPLNLQPHNWPDGITTSLLFNDEPFCTHTWYSREYGVDTYHTTRIDDIYHQCKTQQAKETNY